MIFYHIQECECLRPRGAEAVWEAADGKPDHPRRGWLRPHGGRNSAGYGRFRACGVPGRTGTDILGPCTDYIHFAGKFRWAYPAFGANALRAAWLEKLAAAGYSLPALVHPRAYVSPTADIRPGAVVLALAAVGACAVVEQGAIVNMGAIADHDCVVGACAHLAPGAIVKAGNTVPAQMKIESGTVLERGAAFLPLGGQHV